jgi:hypothetical protein
MAETSSSFREAACCPREECAGRWLVARSARMSEDWDAPRRWASSSRLRLDGFDMVMGEV